MLPIYGPELPQHMQMHINPALPELPGAADAGLGLHFRTTPQPQPRRKILVSDGFLPVVHSRFHMKFHRVTGDQALRPGKIQAGISNLV